MNEIVNKFLLTGDKSMLEMHLKQPAALGQPGFQKFKETGNTNFIYKMNLIKLVFNKIWLMEILTLKRLRDVNLNTPPPPLWFFENLNTSFLKISLNFFKSFRRYEKFSVNISYSHQFFSIF